MKKIIFSIFILSLAVSSVQAQKYMTKTGHIRFFSSTPVEDIEAINKQVNAALDSQTGEFVFRALMKSFQFEKALMQEHFNENYVESDKFPNATFKGKIINLDEIDFTKNGTYKTIVEGDLTIKDVTKRVKEEGTLEVSGDKINGKSTFVILLADYQIKVPSAVANNISKSIQINVDVTLEKMK